jgi:Tfp pilus assembly protein PilF
MHTLKSLLRTLRFLLPVLLVPILRPFPARCQDSSAEPSVGRGNRAEIAVTVRDANSGPISGPAMVKLHKSGVPTDQGATRGGRAFFILNGLGDYTIVVDAPGYENAQKEVSMPTAIEEDVDIYMKRTMAANEAVGVPGRPVLSPKAKEALDKGLQALNQNKMDQAEKYVGEAVKLAPGHPDVLFVQGVLYLRQRNWAQAQAALEKAIQFDPNHARALAALGMAFSNQAKYDEAIPPLEKSIQLDPAPGYETHWALARSYYHRERYDDALKFSQQALTESNGKAPEIALLVAESLTAVGRYEESAQILRDYLKNHGSDPEAGTARRWLDRLTASGKIRQ